MTSRSRDQDILPVRSDPERMARNSQTPSLDNTLLTSRQMAARMAEIRITNIWNVISIQSRPKPVFHKKENDMDVPASNEENEFVLETEDLRPTNVEIQRMIDSALYVFQESTLNHRIGEMVETKVASLLEITYHEAAKGEKTSVYKDFESFVRLIVFGGGVNVANSTKVHNLAGSQDFA